ncbi:hypothetical protein GA0115240_16313 [Streptomyces sp. DvalAA-14]|uniref:hypothetical protein n=1 Tax=unclassified Streptomyces TaxID=2593676 RepID=UPI00081B109D|nr:MULTISPECIES: hypothetical protein [unclassified Streptomyces]MYS24290.1 hypothetical protein [Streptomyces sp. SID4948]SCE44685.1 hypothetical protein GA0115240_16313 [Streptomyces sp. DvalAA-14]
MTRSSLPIAAAFAAAAGLLLTACGGGGSDGSDQAQPSTTAAAPTATTAPATPTPPPTTATGPAAPTFVLPSDAKVVFTGFDGSDAKTAPVLRDVKNIVMTMQEAEGEGKGSTPNIKRYFSGLQAATVSDTAINYRKSGLTITGTLRDYRPTVAFDAADRAQVSYCEDESKAYDKVIATGQVRKTTPELRDFSLWRMGLVRNAAGDWQVVDYSQQTGVSKCAGS